MALTPGEKLGSYLVLAPLGVGGMGEVYRATDTKLDREVAIKVLPAALARDPERLARFEREAKVLASLNHPNIAQIYAVEESPAGTDPHYKALVMELVKGETLKGPVPLDTALKYAAQIASALDAAHEKGITHRDLKPANIMVTPEGVIKVLDFGLAAITQPSQGDQQIATNIATLTMSPTQTGMIMGTAPYMSPEQASGKPVDRRTDIWAFGVVLWELLTGKKLFDGETISHILAAVLKDEPNVDSVPEQVRPLLKRCLEKDVKKRLQSIGDWDLLLTIGTGSAGGAGFQPAAEASASASSRVGKIAIAAAAVFALAAVALGVVAYRHANEEPPRAVKMSVLPPDKATIIGGSLPAVSPDGRHLAFVATADGKTELWVRDLDSLAARALTGTDEARDPFWSPDSRSIAFYADNKLKRIDAAGGPALVLCGIPADRPRGGSWSKNDVLVFAPNNGNNGIFRVPSSGGIATPVTELDKASGDATHRFPWFLPDGRHFLYTVPAGGVADKVAVYVGDVDSKAGAKNRRRVLAASSMVVYSPPGYLLFVRDQTLMAQGFDAAKLQTTGDAVPIAEQVDSGNNAARYQFSLSQNGVLAYSAGGVTGTYQLTWTDRSGKASGTIGSPNTYADFRLSPDEKRIAFERFGGGNQDIWVMDLERGVTSRLTFDPAADRIPLWSPDGLRILYANGRSGGFDLYSRAATGAGPEEALVKIGAPNAWGTSWSHDGRFLLYTSRATGAKTGYGVDLWIAPQFGDRKPFPYLQTEFDESDGVFSPDGRWVAYVSSESGRPEIYVQAFPPSGAKFQISTGGGAEPQWRNDGTELFYRSNDGNLMVVPVKSGAVFETGVPRPLFPIAVNASGGVGYHNYAVSNDGQRFLVASNAAGQKSVPMTVVLNWQAALKK